MKTIFCELWRLLYNDKFYKITSKFENLLVKLTIKYTKITERNIVKNSAFF